jgi:hypothetical protein
MHILVKKTTSANHNYASKKRAYVGELYFIASHKERPPYLVKNYNCEYPLQQSAVTTILKCPSPVE